MSGRNERVSEKRDRAGHWRACQHTRENARDRHSVAPNYMASSDAESVIAAKLSALRVLWDRVIPAHPQSVSPRPQMTAHLVSFN
jgi:hypothetical protein